MSDLRALVRRHLVGAWRHRWLAIAAMWGLCVAGWVASAFVPNSYEANARLYVDADAVLTPLLKGLALDNSVGNQLEVLQRTLLSRPNLERLVSKTDLELSVRGPADLERLVGRLATDIKVVAQTRNLFTITYRNTSPRVAYDVVQTILNIFVETKAGGNRLDLENARQFLQQQINGYEQQLREAERKRAEFKAQYVDLLPSDASGTTKLEEARVSVRRLEGALADATDKRARLQQELAITPALVVTETDPGVPAGVAGGGGGELAAAERRLQDLLATETDANPDVLRQRRVIAQLRSTGGGGGVVTPGRAARNRSVPNEVFAQLKLALVTTEGEVASLTRQVADGTRERDRLEAVARGVPGLQAQYTSLDRDYDVVRKNYDELIARRESMRISAAADADADKVKLQVVDPPQVPQLPVAPKRGMLLSGVLAAGLLGGAALAVALSQLDCSFYTPKELQALGLPVAGGVSMLARPSDGDSRAMLGVAAACVAVLLLCGVYGGLMLRLMRAAGSA